MSGVVVLGLLWAVVGVWTGSRWWRERAAMLVDDAGPVDTARPRFGQAVAGGAVRRRQAMRLAYAAGASAVALGLLVGGAWLLALGAALVNLGTIYRHLVFLLDELPDTMPIGQAVGRHRRGPRHGVRRHGLRRPVPVGGALIGNLAD